MCSEQEVGLGDLQLQVLKYPRGLYTSILQVVAFSCLLKRGLKAFSCFPGSSVWWVCSNPKATATDQRHFPKRGTPEFNSSR